MKATKLSSYLKNTALLVAAVLLFASTLNASDLGNGKKDLTRLARMNLLAGIQSENYGVKRDCIYFAALYNVKEAANILKKELMSEKDPVTSVLISLALYKLGEYDESIGLYGDALTDWNNRVRLISEEILNSSSSDFRNIAASSGKH